MKLCIFYIATGSYKNYYEDFITSLHNFFPEYEKYVIYINDNIDLYNNIVKRDDNITVYNAYIPDMPWPLVTLLKFHWCFKYLTKGYDGYFYFNGNAVILPMTDICKNELLDALSENKIISSYHSFFAKNGEEQQKTDTLNKKHTGNIIHEIQAGFFGGSYQTIYKLCQDVITYIDTELKKNKIPVWHDETAYNIQIFDLFINNKINIHSYMSTRILDKNEFPYSFICVANGEYKKNKRINN